MSRKYRNRKSRKSRKSKPRKQQQQPREFRTQRHLKNRAIPRHEMIVEKKPPVPTFPTQQQDSENRWFYHILRLQSHARACCEK